MGNSIQNALGFGTGVEEDAPPKQTPVTSFYSKWPGLIQNIRSKELDYDYVMKIILIGDSGSGKSALISRFTRGEFTDSFQSTIGIEFSVRTIEYAGYAVKLQIWDTAGPERFRSVTSAYYRGSHAVLICFNVANGCDATSTESLGRWKKDVVDHTTDAMEHLISFVAMKLDLEPSLLYQPWQDARNLWPAVKPAVDPDCAFAVLPPELVYHILFFYLDVSSISRGYRGVNGVPVENLRRSKLLQHPVPTRQEVEAISAKYGRPVYLTSSKEKIGVDEVFRSVVAGVLENYNVIPRMSELEHRMLNPLCIDVTRETRPVRVHVYEDHQRPVRADMPV